MVAAEGCDRAAGHEILNKYPFAGTIRPEVFGRTSQGADRTAAAAKYDAHDHPADPPASEIVAQNRVWAM